MEKITTLKLYFEKPYKENELLEKGFLKIDNESKKYVFYELKINGLHLLYLNKQYNDKVTIGELTIYIKEDRMTRYDDAKEFELVNGAKILKQLKVNDCNNLELYGLGDIRESLILQDSKWNKPSWLPNSLLYIDEYSGLSYHQYGGYYKICYEDDNGINFDEVFKKIIF